MVDMNPVTEYPKLDVSVFRKQRDIQLIGNILSTLLKHLEQTLKNDPGRTDPDSTQDSDAPFSIKRIRYNPMADW